jgi:cell division protein FtsI (penicillin-binding protein 3)
VSATRANVVAAIVAASVCAAFAVALAQVVRLQTDPDPRLRERIETRAARSETPGIRGDILDRRGRVMATTRYGWRAFVDPERLPEDPHPVIGELARITRTDPGPVGLRVVAALAFNDGARGAEPAAVETSGRAGWRAALEAIGEAWAGEPDASGGPGAKLRRYVRVGPVLTEAQASSLREAKLPGVHLERVPVRESPGAVFAANVLGRTSEDPAGRLGLEGAMHRRLAAEPARARYVRDARGRALWIEAGDWETIRRGAPLRLSLDLAIQDMVLEALHAGVARAQAQGGRAIVMDPLTGEIVAMADVRREASDAVPIPWVRSDTPREAEPELPPFDTRARLRLRVVPDDERAAVHPALAVNRCVESVYEPGSTFKPFMWAAAVGAGVAEPDEVLDTEGGRWRTFYGRYIEDVEKRERMTLLEVLVRSSNIGMIKLVERMTPAEASGVIRAFGFGSRTGVPLPGEPAGLVTPLRRWSKYTHTSVAFGYEIAVTPLQMVRAFSAFARPGQLAGTVPGVRLTAPNADDGGIAERAVPAWAAVLAREPMTEVVERVRESEALRRREAGLPERPEPRYRLFGKSGTAKIGVEDPPEGMKRPSNVPAYLPWQFRSSFIAAGPTEAPRLVAMVIIDDPGPELVRERRAFGSRVAGPVADEILTRALLYLGVPPSQTSPRPAEGAVTAATHQGF